ncbi:MAG: hypothetical protein V3R83_09610 [Gammaproteobacteria bacterium]
MKHARKDYDRIQDPAGLIGEDEPVFLLRAKDTVAPKAVRAWADLADAAGASRVIVLAAIAQSERMERWQAENGRKVPDMPEKGEADHGAFYEGQEVEYKGTKHAPDRKGSGWRIFKIQGRVLTVRSMKTFEEWQVDLGHLHE